jgi:hypothetical protein
MYGRGAGGVELFGGLTALHRTEIHTVAVAVIGHVERS